MYSIALILHSWLRWFAILAGFGAIAAAVAPGSVRSEKAGLLFMIAMDLQMLLGVLLYGFLSPNTTAVVLATSARRCAIPSPGSGPSSTRP